MMAQNPLKLKNVLLSYVAATENNEALHSNEGIKMFSEILTKLADDEALAAPADNDALNVGQVFLMDLTKRCQQNANLAASLEECLVALRSRVDKNTSPAAKTLIGVLEKANEAVTIQLDATLEQARNGEDTVNPQK